MECRTWILTGLVLSLAMSLAGCKKEPTSATVVRRDVEGFIVLEGELVTPPTEYAQVLPPYRATVEKVMATEGQWVRDGEVLMTLNFPGVQAAYEQARQYVQTAETNLANARSQLDSEVKRLEAEVKALRARRDAGEDVSMQMQIVQQELDMARRDLDANLVPYKQQLAEAQRYLKEAQSGAKLASIRAPISGTVLRMNAQPGVEVGEDADEPVATICDLAALLVHVPLSTDQAGILKEGMPVILTFEGLNEEFDGKVTRIVTRPSNGGVMYVAVVSFDNEKGLVKPGTEVGGVAIKTGEVENVIAVPTEAVDQDESGRPIVKVLRNGEWVPTVVEVGLSGGGYTEIKSGVNEGDSVQVTP